MTLNTKAKQKLTQSFTNNVSATGKKQRFADDKVVGLELRVAPAGKKVWAIRYRDVTGASREMKIGAADKMPLEEARKVARVKLANVPAGDDPLENKRAAKREALLSQQKTFAAMTEKYRTSRNYLTKRASTQSTYDNSLDRHLLPRIGSRSLPSLSRGVLSGLLDDLAMEHSGNVSNQARSALSVVLSFAVERDVLDFNPMRGIKAKHKTAIRERVLNDEELKGLWESLDSGGTVTNMVKLHMLLPARAREIAGIRWDEVDFSQRLWVIPADRMKGGLSHELPLGDEAVKLLTLCKDVATTEWVFANKADTAAMDRQRPSRFCNRFAKNQEWASFGPHDLRRTIATRLAELGMGHATIERMLGHKVGAGRAIVNYDHHDYRDRKRHAVEAWETKLMSIIKGVENTNVHVLREIVS